VAAGLVGGRGGLAAARTAASTALESALAAAKARTAWFKAENGRLVAELDAARADVARLKTGGGDPVGEGVAGVAALTTEA
jgi:hypothetical protein